jgi:hypothetical protein
MNASRLHKLTMTAAPPLQIEGRGNGIKTNVVNCVDIAKALERPPECAFLCIAPPPPPSGRFCCCPAWPVFGA